MDGHMRGRRPCHPVTVLSVETLRCPDSTGDWPCAICGEPFAVSGSWQISLVGAEPVVSCSRCADHARRNGTIHLPAHTTLSLNQTWTSGVDGPIR